MLFGIIMTRENRKTHCVVCEVSPRAYPKGPRRLYLAVIMPWGGGGWSRLYEGDKKKFKLKIRRENYIG